MLVSSMGYTDLPIPESGKHWSYAYYQKAIQLQIFQGSEVSTSILNQEIPREMMAYMISNGLGEMEIDGYLELRDTITDLELGGKNSYPIVKVYSTGILNGYPDGTFHQKESLTRAETAVCLGRFIQYSSGEEIAGVKEKQTEATEKKQDAIIESILQKKVDFLDSSNEINYYQYYSVSSAQELKEKYPIYYYSILEPEDNSLFSTIVTNNEELRSPFNDVDLKTYAYRNMEDIGIAKIEKTTDQYNSEQLKVTPTYKNTERMEAVLIKGNKIVCKLTGVKSSTDTDITYWPPSEYYNGAYENTKLMDFDYIGFYEYTGSTNVFLVKNSL
jgi:hypothetical protein